MTADSELDLGSSGKDDWGVFEELERDSSPRVNRTAVAEEEAEFN
jgi:hypothetical protein